MMIGLTTLLLTALTTGPAQAPVSAPPPAVPIPARCNPTADKTRGVRLAGPTKLGDLPPASQVLAVFRKDADGCPQPVVLRKGIGAAPAR
ncbi:MAG: hypothetical protein FJ335_01890 [Sphingomonadales bacterium]|nr:hypothetical protein [Sphingomonadales bacterium]